MEVLLYQMVHNLQLVNTMLFHQLALFNQAVLLTLMSLLEQMEPNIMKAHLPLTLETETTPITQMAFHSNFVPKAQSQESTLKI
jgi:hypothetical protein